MGLKAPEVLVSLNGKIKDVLPEYINYCLTKFITQHQFKSFKRKH